MNYGWHDFLGNAGVLLICLCYLLLQLGRMSPASLLFSAANGAGALMILVSLTQAFNLSAFLMEAGWLLASLYGVVRYYTRPAAAAGEPGGPPPG